MKTKSDLAGQETKEADLQRKNGPPTENGVKKRKKNRGKKKKKVEGETKANPVISKSDLCYC